MQGFVRKENPFCADRGEDLGIRRLDVTLHGVVFAIFCSGAAVHHRQRWCGMSARQDPTQSCPHLGANAGEAEFGKE